jgi:hypothetical protein
MNLIDTFKSSKPLKIRFESSTVALTNLKTLEWQLELLYWLLKLKLKIENNYTNMYI